MIGVYLHVPGLTAEQYHATAKQIADRGVSQEGLRMHSAFLEGETVAIYDVWDSKEAYQAFAAQLADLAAGMGGALPEPQFVEMLGLDIPS